MFKGRVSSQNPWAKKYSKKPKGTYKKRKSKNSYVTKEQVARMLKVKTELKYFDTTLTPTAVDFNGACRNISLIPVGTNNNTRIGLTVLPTRLDWKIRWAGASNPSNICRLIIFRWKMASGSDVPAPNELIVPTLLGSSEAPLSPLNQDERGRFEVLYDKNYNVFTNNLEGSVLTESGTLKLAKKPIEFASAVTTFGINTIWYMVISDDGALPFPVFSSCFRLHYTDS